MDINDSLYLWISIMQLWICIIQLHIFIITLWAAITIYLNDCYINHIYTQFNYDYPWGIMDIHIWIMDVHNWILDIYNCWILWIAMTELWITMIDPHEDVINRKHFRITDPLWGESTGHQWIPLTKVSDAELWWLLWSALEQTFEHTIETHVIWDAIALTMTTL